jgi:hypothetical protein
LLFPRNATDADLCKEVFEQGLLGSVREFELRVVKMSKKQAVKYMVESGERLRDLKNPFRVEVNGDSSYFGGGKLLPVFSDSFARPVSFLLEVEEGEEFRVTRFRIGRRLDGIKIPPIIFDESTFGECKFYVRMKGSGTERKLYDFEKLGGFVDRDEDCELRFYWRSELRENRRNRNVPVKLYN